IEAPAGAAPVRIDDVALASSAAPDGDGDHIPDALDHCPQDAAHANVLATAPAQVTVTTCRPGPASVKLPLPSLTATCTGAQPTIAGEVMASGSSPLAVPLAISGGVAQLPPGSYAIRWEVRLPDGRIAATLAQQVLVTLAESTTCCAPGQKILKGTANQDSLVGASATATCVLALGGGDFVVTSTKNDLLMGGPGDDALNGGGGQDEIIGGDGGDAINGGSGGTLVAFGGEGADNITATTVASAKLWGGPGDDKLTGSPGADILV